MSAGVSDEVWRGLEPSPGDRRWTRRLWVAAAAVFALGFAGNLLWISPLVTPQLNQVSPIDMSSLEQVDGDLRIRVVVQNQGPTDVRILEVGLADPGLALLRVEGSQAGDPSPFPLTLAPRERVDFALHFRVADCTAVDVRSPFSLEAEVHRPWGQMHVGLSAGFTTEGPEEDLVDFWCGR